MNLRNFLIKAALVNSTAFCFFGYFVEPSMANEVLTDRCSADVAFPKTYSGDPNSPGTIILSRDSNGRTEWTPPFQVKDDGNGRIRWWCNSTSGNIFDPGTWHLEPVSTGTCVFGVAKSVVSDDPSSLPACLKAAESAKIAESYGWTAERSRCDDHSTVIRARLDTGRLLQIECLGNKLPLA